MKPDEMDELVDHAAKAVYDIGLLVWTGSMDDARRVALAVIDAVRAFQAEHGAWSDAEMNKDWWVAGPRDGEA